MKIKVFLPGEHPKIWEYVHSRLPLSKSWSPESFKNYLMARYQLDITIVPQEFIGTFWVEEQDWTMFLLKWQNKEP